MHCGKRNQGFTLLELLVTITVASIILSFGVPSFLDIVRNNRAAANSNDLLIALAIARSEAVKRGTTVTVCASADGSNCNGTWDQGWIVVDAAVPEVLRIWPAPSGDSAVTTLSGNGPVTMDSVRFLPRGSARTAAAMPVTFHMEIEGCSNLQARNIELNAVGRATVERVAC